MYLIRKTSGRIEEFNEDKLERSLRRVGASNELIKQITQIVHREKPKSTRQLHHLISTLLAQTERPAASRYNLKRALMELGPAGYSFEQYIADLFQYLGYKTKTDQIVQGRCVEHEIDVILERDNKRSMVECKFHNALGIKSDVKITLYVFARFLDLVSAWKTDPDHHLKFDEVWLVTNTTFTSRAEQYAACENIKLLSWNKGPEKSLARLIDDAGLHPITTLTGLTRRQKREFIKHGFVLCKDVDKHKQLLHQLGFSQDAINQLMSEAHQVCTITGRDNH